MGEGLSPVAPLDLGLGSRHDLEPVVQTGQLSRREWSGGSRFHRGEGHVAGVRGQDADPGGDAALSGLARSER